MGRKPMSEQALGLRQLPGMRQNRLKWPLGCDRQIEPPMPGIRARKPSRETGVRSIGLAEPY